MSDREGVSKDQEERELPVGVKTVLFNFEWQSEDEANKMQLFVDSDWAGCDEAVDFLRTLDAWNTHPENMVFHRGSCGDAVGGGRAVFHDRRCDWRYVNEDHAERNGR